MVDLADDRNGLKTGLMLVNVVAYFTYTKDKCLINAKKEKPILRFVKGSCDSKEGVRTPRVVTAVNHPLKGVDNES